MTTITIRTINEISEVAIRLANKIAKRTGGVTIISDGYVKVVTNRK